MLRKERESRSPVIGPAGKASGRQGKGKAKQRSTGGSELPGVRNYLVLREERKEFFQYRPGLDYRRGGAKG